MERPDDLPNMLAPEVVSINEQVLREEGPAVALPRADRQARGGAGGAPKKG